ncbi:MAG: serine hydrolase domain-containing protein [Candidatus Hermodarchaeota archaeon]
MPRINKTIFRKLGIPFLVITLGVAGILPGWLLIVRLNSVEYWTKISPEFVRMDSGILDNMINHVENHEYDVYSILVIKNGFIVKEWYDKLFHKDFLFRVFSVSKSITSTLIGIAFDKGFINSLDELVLDYFPDKDIANLDTQKESMTIEHLLTMTTGLDWAEYYSYDNPLNPYHTWKASEDHVEFVLNRTMIAAPGLVWNYNTGATHLLTAILERATNMSTLDFANQYLFGPLSIEDYTWLQDPQGVACGGDGLFLRPRDMAKIGYLFLKGGIWENKRIISKNWVVISTNSIVELNSNLYYGYQWWIYPADLCYRALGYGGQVISVFYELNLIVVFTGMNLEFNFPLFLIYNYILPAIR